MSNLHFQLNLSLQNTLIKEYLLGPWGDGTVGKVFGIQI